MHFSPPGPRPLTSTLSVIESHSTPCATNLARFFSSTFKSGVIHTGSLEDTLTALVGKHSLFASSGYTGQIIIPSPSYPH
jgi:hypothetical protein